MAITAPSKKSSGWQPQLDTYCDAIVKARAATAAFIRDMEEGRSGRWLTLLGDPGVGKTMLARQMLAQSRLSNPGNVPLWISGDRTGDAERNPRPKCVWIDASAFAKRMLNGQFDEPESYFNDWCVVFDDLGAARDTATNYIADAIYRFANTRLGRWTIWTSNLRLHEISGRLDPRIASRLIRDDNRMIEIEARDYALTGRKMV